MSFVQGRGERTDRIAGVWSVAAILTIAVAGLCSSVRVARAESEPTSSGGPQTMRRLTEDEYKRSIAQIFGADVVVPGRFEPPVREGGLLAIGNSQVVVTPSGLEQDLIRARQISAAVLSDSRRKNILQCQPEPPSAFDESCATQLLSKYGRLLLRRPLTDHELKTELSISRHAAENAGSFYKGLESGLTGLLVSPAFLFRMEASQPDPANDGALRLDDYSFASRISFLIWDSPPDEELLNAAANGDLDTKPGLARQVDRLMSSPRFELGVRSFFSDMLAYDQFDGLAKDPALFPVFNPQLRNDAEEQSLRTIVDYLVTQKKDYRGLFITKNTFLSRSLGALYGVRVDSEAVGGWMPYSFGPNDPYAGLLTMAAFMMLDASHEGRTSPTIRGKNLRELLLCQRVPPPPGNVNFKIVQDTNNPLYKTARQRLVAHRDNPVCAGCHSITDPVGLAMENYTAVGQYRTTENGAPIDASGTFDGKPFKDLLQLEKQLAESPALPNCLVQRTYEYGVGRQIASGERDWVKDLEARFAQQQYEFPALVRDIATSAAFRSVSASATTATNTVALN
jgi:Protein of unknown function (DUF1592)/Protein of unknown function (DUF1588)/Protein of unknown function (DUF1585)/Protein of unknown function (DUF1595)